MNGVVSSIRGAPRSRGSCPAARRGRAGRRAAAASSRSRRARSAAGRTARSGRGLGDEHLTAHRRARTAPAPAGAPRSTRRPRLRPRGSRTGRARPARPADARRSRRRRRRRARPSRLTQRAGSSAPSPGCTNPPANSPSSGGESRSTHSAAKPSSTSASYSRRSSPSSASSTASRRLPTRRRASPASRSMRSSAALGQLPEPGGRSGPSSATCLVVGRRAAPQREAAVPPARAGRDLARLEEPDAETALGERQRAGAAGDAASDDHHVHRAGRRAGRGQAVAPGRASMKLSARRDPTGGASPPLDPRPHLDEAAELELEQRRRDRTRRRGRSPRAISSAVVAPASSAARTAAAVGAPAAGSACTGGRPLDADRLEHVVRAGHGRRAEPEQRVRARTRAAR